MMLRAQPPVARPGAATGGQSLGISTRRPLVVTGDDDLLDDLLRLAAAAGTEVDLATDPAAARGRHPSAPLVLVGADQAQAYRRARLPRRRGLVLVSRSVDPEPDAAVQAAAAAVGADHLALVPAAESWLVEQLAGCGRRPAPAPVAAVLGGRGGAGASLLATGLAWTAAEHGRRVLLVDGDPLGGGLDLALGWEADTGPRWPELAGTSGRVDGAALVRTLPGRRGRTGQGKGELALLSFDRRDLLAAPPEAMAAVLEAGRHARDLVVVDAPRRVDPAAQVALQAADLSLLVVPAEMRATMAARRVAAVVREHCADLRLVVRGPAPGGLTAAQVGRFLRLPVAAELRPEPGLLATVEAGQAPTATGRGPLAALCRSLVEELCPRAGRAVPV